MKTRLEWYEASQAMSIVGLRHSMSLRDKRKDNHGYSGRDVHDNFWGVLGEMAFAKLKNVYYAGTVDTFKDADVGENYQVRTVGSNKNRNLIIRPDDPTQDIYVLVEVAKCGGYYSCVLHGGIYGYDGKRDEWLSDFGQPHRPSAYRVPNRSLNKEFIKI